jgi:hypothetical protein
MVNARFGLAKRRRHRPHGSWMRVAGLAEALQTELDTAEGRGALLSQMGVVSSFSFGEGKGILKGATRALGVELRYVSPAVWKRDLGVSAVKGTSIRRARRYSPSK